MANIIARRKTAAVFFILELVLISGIQRQLLRYIGLKVYPTTPSIQAFFTQRNEGMICAASIRLVQDSVQCSAVYVCIPPAEDKAIYNTRGLKRLLFPPHIIIIHTPTNITVFLFLHTYITYNPLLQFCLLHLYGCYIV